MGLTGTHLLGVCMLIIYQYLLKLPVSEVPSGVSGSLSDIHSWMSNNFPEVNIAN